MSSNAQKQALDRIVAETWEDFIDRDPYTAASVGRKVVRLDRGDLADAEAAAVSAKALRDRLDQIDISQLHRTDRLSAAFVRHWLDIMIAGPERWWTSFPVAPYSGIYLSFLPRALFPQIELTDPVEAERYLKLVHDFVAMIDAARLRVEAQAQRGWRLPRPALPTARKALEGNGAIAIATIILAADRPASEETRAAVAAAVEQSLRPAVARLLAAIGPDYEAAAPAAAGMMHQPNGAQAYRLWLRYHLGSDLDPADIHRIGREEVARLAAEMEQVRREKFGHDDDEASFHAKLAEDPRAKASSAETLEAIYRRHMNGMGRAFADMFRKAPRSIPKIARLPRQLEAGMTFGYYEPPKEVGEDGVYFYSGNGIPDRMQINAGALIFHELVPGHHLHLTRQQENETLPEIRRKLTISTAFNEGWAEYASGLGEEAGLLDDPYDDYGFLSHQRFVAQRLVVDTGLNALGWTLDEAHAYMSANTLEKAEQVTSEILRYSTDLPGQALCYRWGFLKFRELRARAQATLGSAFNLADFHEAILDEGALPLPVLETSLKEWAEERAGSQRD